MISGGGLDGGTFRISDQTFDWGAFVNALIFFALTAAVIYFAVVAPLNAVEERRRRRGQAPADTPPTQEELLTEIRDLLRDQQGSRGADRRRIRSAAVVGRDLAQVALVVVRLGRLAPADVPLVGGDVRQDGTARRPRGRSGGVAGSAAARPRSGAGGRRRARMDVRAGARSRTPDRGGGLGMKPACRHLPSRPNRAERRSPDRACHVEETRNGLPGQGEEAGRTGRGEGRAADRQGRAARAERGGQGRPADRQADRREVPRQDRSRRGEGRRGRREADGGAGWRPGRRGRGHGGRLPGAARPGRRLPGAARPDRSLPGAARPDGWTPFPAQRSPADASRRSPARRTPSRRSPAAAEAFPAQPGAVDGFPARPGRACAPAWRTRSRRRRLRGRVPDGCRTGAAGPARRPAGRPRALRGRDRHRLLRGGDG